MNRIDKENVLLQSLMGIAGLTLLVIGIITVVAAWRGPAPSEQPQVHTVSTTLPDSTKPAEDPLPAQRESKPAEQPPTPVTLESPDRCDEDFECFPEFIDEQQEQSAESL